jgi:hypothetical protein
MKMKNRNAIWSFVLVAFLTVFIVAVVHNSAVVQDKKQQSNLATCYNSTIDYNLKKETYGSIRKVHDTASLLSIRDKKVPDFDSYYKMHPSFARCAKIIYIKAKEYGLPPFDLVAIAQLESGYGTSYLAEHYKNYFGLGAVDWNPGNACNFSKYPISDAIDMQVRIIKHDYYDKYHTTNLWIIGKHYCSKSAFWTATVRSFSKDMQQYFNKGIVK